MIRPYQTTDKAEVIALFRLNTPAYFHCSEEEEYREYLNRHAQHYFVIEAAGGLVGAGGYNFSDDYRLARISWDLVHPAHQGKGLGNALTRYRIAEITKDVRVKQIIVRTSQMAWRFYEKLGFVLEKTEKDFWAAGFDLYQMRMAVS